MERERTTELVSRITAYLAQQERLVVAYLFGSLAEETDHRLSDVDVALLYLDYQFAHLIRRIREEGLGAGYQGHRDALEQARRLSKRLATLSAGTP